MTTFDVLDGKTVVFVGGGNMAQAIIDGLLHSRAKHNLDLKLGVSEPNHDKRAYFADKGLQTADATDIQKVGELLEQADIVVLAIKPQSLAEAAVLAPYLSGKLVLSILAGVSVARLADTLGVQRLVRAMPNLPASVGAGATGLFTQTSDDDKTLAYAIMASSGMVCWVNDESLLHAVTAVAGSAPAYFFYILESMIHAGVSMGLSATDAKDLAVYSMIGAGELAKHADPEILRQKVTSKGGTTATAIAVFDQKNLPAVLHQAMHACHARSVELGQS